MKKRGGGEGARASEKMKGRRKIGENYIFLSKG